MKPFFDEREKCGDFYTLLSMLLKQAQNFFHYFRMGPDTFCYILQSIRSYIKNRVILGNVFLQKIGSL